MTTTNSDSELIKMDCIGRVRTTAEHREALLTAYEESALSGSEFCKHHGIKYQTFATWLQKHRRATGAYPSMESLKKHSPLFSLSLAEVELPQSAQSPPSYPKIRAAARYLPSLTNAAVFSKSFTGMEVVSGFWQSVWKKAPSLGRKGLMYQAESCDSVPLRLPSYLMVSTCAKAVEDPGMKFPNKDKNTSY